MKRNLMVHAAACVFLLVSMWFPTRAEILKINSLQAIVDAYAQMQGNILFVFDVDQTLIMPVDAIWQEDRLCYVDPLANDQCQNYDLKDIVRGQKISERFLHCAMRPVEQMTVSVVTDLQKHASVIALTNLAPDQFGYISSFKDWRYKQLFDMGMDFSHCFPFESVSFDHLPSSASESEGVPTFYKGILFAANSPKGVVLDAFLDTIDQTYDLIIAVDDRKKYLESIEQEMSKRNQKVVCYWYAGADCQKSELDIEIAQLQLQYIRDYYLFLSDVEAACILGKKKVNGGSVRAACQVEVQSCP